MADFANCLVNYKTFFDKIYDQVKDLDIGILVNNVGIGKG